MELVVVMTVTMVLTGFLLPALSKIKSQAQQVVCGSNLRQLGIACVAFADDMTTLPESYYGQQGQAKSEMMVLHFQNEGNDQWEGLGHLWRWGYLSSPAVFFCPSHRGEHMYDRYEEDFLHPNGKRVYGNYHYAGDQNWQLERPVPRRLDSAIGFVIATDGLRTTRDINHRYGMNVLRSDVSVRWREDLADQIASKVMAPGQATDEDETEEDQRYSEIWSIINEAF